MKFFQQLLVAPAALVLLAPLYVSASEINLDDISDLYLYHLKLMKEYKSKFGSIIYSYDHEQVVRNPKETIQDLINWLDWEWNEKYLSPQKSKRSVFTASSAQVRKKINPNSSGCWKKYEDLLEPISELFPTYN